MVDATPRVHIAHLVNPALHPIDSDLATVQPLTFESMRVAAATAAPVADVELLTAQYPEDHPIIPAYFDRTPDLEVSVADMHHFTRYRKLPMLRDLLDRLYNGTQASHLIYTNVDIIVHPEFYVEVAKRIQSKLDAFIINRRRVPRHYESVSDLAEIVSLKGKSHPGFDCFVFHRQLYDRFRLENVCVGIPFIGILFAQNLFCHAKRFRLYDKDFLTFHVGMDVFKDRDPEYLAYNKTQFWQAVAALEPALDSRKFPWGDSNVIYRLIKWGFHPSIPIHLALKLEPRRWLRRSSVA